MSGEGGYRLKVVSAYLDAHARRRPEDGRVMSLNGKLVRESHRETIANWEARSLDHIPLGRWDELLLDVGLMLWEFEHWAEQHLGTDGYMTSDDLL